MTNKTTPPQPQQRQPNQTTTHPLRSSLRSLLRSSLRLLLVDARVALATPALAL
jgi:hypothetical protein